MADDEGEEPYPRLLLLLLLELLLLLHDPSQQETDSLFDQLEGIRASSSISIRYR